MPSPNSSSPGEKSQSDFCYAIREKKSGNIMIVITDVCPSKREPFGILVIRQWLRHSGRDVDKALEYTLEPFPHQIVSWRSWDQFF